MQKRQLRLARNRPAETGGVAGALALLIAHTAGLEDPNLIVALASVIGFAPAAITWCVALMQDTGPVETVGEAG